MEGKKECGIPKTIGPLPPTPGRAPEEATNIGEPPPPPKKKKKKKKKRESKMVQKERI